MKRIGKNFAGAAFLLQSLKSDGEHTFISTKTKKTKKLVLFILLSLNSLEFFIISIRMKRIGKNFAGAAFLLQSFTI